MGVIFLRARNPANARVAHRGWSSRPTPGEVIEKNYRIPGGCRLFVDDIVAVARIQRLFVENSETFSFPII